MSSIKWHTEDKRLLPVRATKNSVGYDFKAPNKIFIEPKDTVIIDSLVACDFSDDLWLGIYGRSSFVNKGLTNPLGVGVIDSDYFATGNTIKIAIHNNNDYDVCIDEGDAIAQGIFHKVITAGDEVTTERTGGFGSTDVNNDEYPLTVEIYGKKYKDKYAKDLIHNYYGISVLRNDRNIIFISKDKTGALHSANNFFGQCNGDDLLDNRCWYFKRYSDETQDATKE